MAHRDGCSGIAVCPECGEEVMEREGQIARILAAYNGEAARALQTLQLGADPENMEYTKGELYGLGLALEYLGVQVEPPEALYPEGEGD